MTGKMARHTSQSIALLINQEISAVLTAMRQNVKWSVVPSRYTRAQDEETGEDPLLEAFTALRKKIFYWHDWSEVDPLDYLDPFLNVALSHETSGHITGTALTALCRFLDHDILGVYNGPMDRVMRRVAAAVSQARFESADAASDDNVLFKILQVLLSCVRCPGSRYMTDQNLIDIFQASFNVGHFGGKYKDITGRSQGLLTAASRQILVELVSTIFGQMADLPPRPTPKPPPPSLTTAEPAWTPGVEDTGRSAAGGDAATPRSIDTAHTEANGAVSGREDMSLDGEAADGGAALGLSSRGAPLNATGRSDSALATSSGLTGVTIPMSKPVTTGEAGEEPAHGIYSLAEILGFIIGLISTEHELAQDDMNVLGLELMYTALNAGRSEFAKHEVLMMLLREDAWAGLSMAVKTMQLGTLAGAGQVALSLWLHLGEHLMLQLESFLQYILLRLAGGSRNNASHHQEAALEVILDLCNQPGFIRFAYANVDCRVERTDLFEAICALLSKTAFPVNNPLGPVNLHSFEGLLSILNTLAKGCTGMSSWDDVEDAYAPSDMAAIWEACCDHAPAPPLTRRLREADTADGSLDSPHARAKAKAEEERRALVETALLEKVLKNKLAVAAEHFNRDYKKCFQYLQSIQLIDEKPRAVQIAKFLRNCPGLNKHTIGELLGEHDDFFLEVLDQFTQTFQFEGQTFDQGIRSFLESFRLPGEAQKINRIMESFGLQYHKQCPKLFKNADAVYILAYSVILLNTDQHNSQVKKKMTCDEFIRNNRGINAGENLPQDFLRALYESISRNEIRISSEASASNSNVWAQLARASVAPRGAMLDSAHLAYPKLDRHMFCLMWGPTIAAVSVVLDHADDPLLIRKALDGFLSAAKIASFHHVEEVMDSLIVSLSKFTASLDPAAPKPALAFGENEKARMATQTLFTLANRHGDSLRGGWKNLLSCIMRLFQLDLLPPVVLLLESDDVQGAREKLPRPSASRRTPASASLLARAFSSLISIDSGESAEARPREAEASRNTAACIEACRLDELFADSKFLRAESLIEMVKAMMWAAGPVNRIAASGEESDTAELGLELVIVVALRNRDRLLLIWPLVHDMMSTILARESARTANPIVRRATLGLLRICRRLLHYKADSAGALLKSMQMVLRLDPAVAWELAPAIANEVLMLVRGSGESLRSAQGWRTVCLLISTTGLSPEACATALEALHLAAKPPVLRAASFLPCLEAATSFIENQNKALQPQTGLQAFKVLEDCFDWLCAHDARVGGDTPTTPTAYREADGATLNTAEASGLSSPSTPSTPLQADPDVATMWLALLRLLGKVIGEQHPQLRDQALQLLQRVIMGSDRLSLPASVWLVDVIKGQLLPRTAQFAHHLVYNRREARLYGPPLRFSLKLLSKTLLHYLPLLSEQPSFPEVWAELLHLLQQCTSTKSDELMEVVPEALKNMLLVMAARGVLTPEWKDGEGNSLWDLTWRRAHAVSSGLTPSILAESGLVTLAQPQPPSPSVQDPSAPHGATPSPQSTPGPATAGEGQPADGEGEAGARVPHPETSVPTSQPEAAAADGPLPASEFPDQPQASEQHSREEEPGSGAVEASSGGISPTSHAPEQAPAPSEPQEAQLSNGLASSPTSDAPTPPQDVRASIPTPSSPEAVTVDSPVPSAPGLSQPASPGEAAGKEKGGLAAADPHETPAVVEEDGGGASEGAGTEAKWTDTVQSSLRPADDQAKEQAGEGTTLLVADGGAEAARGRTEAGEEEEEGKQEEAMVPGCKQS